MVNIERSGLKKKIVAFIAAGKTHYYILKFTPATENQQRKYENFTQARKTKRSHKKLKTSDSSKYSEKNTVIDNPK